MTFVYFRLCCESKLSAGVCKAIVQPLEGLSWVGSEWCIIRRLNSFLSDLVRSRHRLRKSRRHMTEGGRRRSQTMLEQGHSLAWHRCRQGRAPMSNHRTQLYPSCSHGRRPPCCVAWEGSRSSQVGGRVPSCWQDRRPWLSQWKPRRGAFYCSLHFSWSWRTEKTISMVDLLALNPHWDSG